MPPIKPYDEMSLQELLNVHDDDPEGYEPNLHLGIKLSWSRRQLLRSEPFLLKALSFGRIDDRTSTLLEHLAWIAATKGNYQKSVELFEFALRIDPNNSIINLQYGHMLFQVGRAQEAFDLFERVIAPKYQKSKIHNLKKGCEVVHLIEPAKQMARFIGELSAKMDLYLKARALGLIEGDRAILCMPPDVLANRAFAEYWSRHVDVVFDEAEIAKTRELYDDNQVFLDYYKMPDGRTLHRDLAHRVVQKMWEDQGRAPLLTLEPAHKQRGWQLLRARGMPEGGWFVCLHVREAGYYKEDVEWGINWHRNADIITYIPAIQEIIARGGWVVRIGDPSMTPLPPMVGLIDLALDPEKEDWVDVFAIAESRFYMGMASGPAAIPVNFGVPVLGTNWFAVGSWPYSNKDLFIHKLFKRNSDGRILSVEEATAPPLYSALEPLLFVEQGLEVIDNSPEELAEVTVEMIERLDGLFKASEGDNRAQDAYKRRADPYKLGMDPCVGRGFLRRYPELIERRRSV